jgi:hypothetical protein
MYVYMYHGIKCDVYIYVRNKMCMYIYINMYKESKRSKKKKRVRY